MGKEDATGIWIMPLAGNDAALASIQCDGHAAFGGKQRLRVSLTVFAVYLGVTKSTVSQWEQGLKKPRGPALRLLDLADRKRLEAIA